VKLPKLPKLTEIKKGLAAVAGAAAEAVSLGILSGTTEKWVTGVIAVGTAFVVYLLPNAQPAPVVAAPVAPVAPPVPPAV
jgi:hypothetical protein